MPYKKKSDRNRYVRRYYNENADSLATLRKLKREQNRLWAVEQLGGACQKCGAQTNLHFDHVDPATKRAAISNILLHSRESISAELQKCQLLCADCHKEKTTTNDEYQNGQAQHGSPAMYNVHKCRCDLCRAWKSTYDKQWKEKRAKNSQRPLTAPQAI
jgi:uncharacterized protein YktB (UPF0637 family)